MARGSWPKDAFMAPEDGTTIPTSQVRTSMILRTHAEADDHQLRDPRPALVRAHVGLRPGGGLPALGRAVLAGLQDPGLRGAAPPRRRGPRQRHPGRDLWRAGQDDL